MLVRNRLIATGPPRMLKLFGDSDWLNALRGKHPEFGELGRSRRVWWFSTDQQPAAEFKTLSRRWPALILLLEVDAEGCRQIGLWKAHAGRVDAIQFQY